jgi:hypothetical protein
MLQSSVKKNRITRKGNCFAIWVGKFDSESAADDYLYFGFPTDFEALPEEANVPELSVLPEAASVRSILLPFSSSHCFIDTAVLIAEEKLIGDVTTAIVYYHTHFDETDWWPPRDAQLTFLGNVEGK